MARKNKAAILAELDEFTRHYLEEVMFTEEKEGEPGPSDIDCLTIESLRESIEDCRNFQEGNKADLEEFRRVSGFSGGGDFWLTRNYHGAGFWDRGLGEVGQRLTDSAHVYGSVYGEWCGNRLHLG